MLWQQMTKLFLWLDLHQAKLAVFKATQNPTAGGGKCGSVAQAFRFQSCLFLAGRWAQHMAPTVLSAKPLVRQLLPCPCGLLVRGSGSCLFQSCWYPCLGSGDRNANLSVSAKADCEDLLTYTAVVCSAYPIYLLALMLSKPKKCFELVPVVMGMSYKIFCSQMQTCLGCVLGWLDSASRLQAV